MNNKMYQRGAILVTSLLLLLVLTVIGVSVMQMTRMQERMAGNTRDVNLAFQGAESALRGGEGKVLSFTTAPTLCTAVGACATVFERNLLPPMNSQAASWWNTAGTTFTDANQGTELASNPRYVVEQVAFVPFSKEFGETSGRDFYQVSARSTGGSGNAESVVQSTFTRTAQ